MEENWKYHGEPPSAGRKLRLISYNEMGVFIPLIYRVISSNISLEKLHWFSISSIETIKNSTKIKSGIVLFPTLHDELKKLIAIKKESAIPIDDIYIQLDNVNKIINKTFSDNGWRNIRKEFSQILKRRKKSHIEISRDLINKLKQYMNKNGFDTFDQAVDELLSSQQSIIDEPIANSQ